MRQLLVLVIVLIALVLSVDALRTSTDREKDKTETLERILNADTGEGNPDADASWINDFIHRLSKDE